MRPIVEAPLANDEVFIESLSWRRIVVVADCPHAESAWLMAGRGRALRLYETDGATGIRTSWFGGWLARGTAEAAAVV